MFNEFLYVWPIVIALMITGLFAGILAGLLGVGGGIIIVPMLYFLLPFFGISAESAIEIAIATSLTIIVPTAISSVRSHYRKGNVDITLFKWWSGFILLFAVIGSLLITSLTGNGLALLFSVIAICVSINLFFRSNAPAMFSQLPNKIVQAVMASLVGLLSVMIGIGGGTLGVPLLTTFNVKAHKAVGTAAAFGLVIALPAVIILLLFSEAPLDAPFGNYGLINIPAFLAMVPLTVLFAPVGVKIGEGLDPAQLKKVFAFALFITGGRMMYQVL